MGEDRNSSWVRPGDEPAVPMVRVSASEKNPRLTNPFAPSLSKNLSSLQHAHQYASRSAPKMLGHAQTLHRLYPDLDRAYLHDRITLETLADYGAQDPES
jgi:hypothetical protein